MGSIEQGCSLSGIELQDYLGGFREPLVLDCSGPPLLPLGTLRLSDQVSWECSWSPRILAWGLVGDLSLPERTEARIREMQHRKVEDSCHPKSLGAIQSHLLPHFLL